MPPFQLGSLRSGPANPDVISLELRRVEAVRRSVAEKSLVSADVQAKVDRDQLARDHADIERTTELLRTAEPALQSWTKPTPASRQTRSVWLLILALWISTALIAAGAVVAIAALAA